MSAKRWLRSLSRPFGAIARPLRAVVAIMWWVLIVGAAALWARSQQASDHFGVRYAQWRPEAHEVQSYGIQWARGRLMIAREARFVEEAKTFPDHSRQMRALEPPGFGISLRRQGLESAHRFITRGTDWKWLGPVGYFHQKRAHSAGWFSRHRLTMPFWALIALMSVIPARHLWRLGLRIRCWRRRRRGLCAECGYDLRESSDRCPECGAINPAWSAVPDDQAAARRAVGGAAV